MFDARPGHGTPIDAEKLRTLQVKGDKTKPRVIEGRHHPETGVAFKTVSTPEGSTTEHNTRDDRVDAVARVSTIQAVKSKQTGRIRNA
jgi:hypothetical protein